MTDYLPKATAPVAFNAVDAILSAIHNDPVWGWLEGYAHMYPNQYIDTATFCSQGPTDAPAIGLGDLLNLAPLGTPEWFAAQQKISTKIISILHDKLFGAMCAAPVTPTAGWCPSQFVTVPGTQALGADGAYATFQVPTGNTSVRVRLTARDTTGGFDQRVDHGSSFPPWVGIETLGGYDTGGSIPSGWSTWSVGSAHVLRFLRYAGGSSTYEIQTNACADAPYDPTPQPIPVGFTPRVVPPTAAVADLSPILFALELKLEELLRVERQVAQDQLPNPETVAAPLDAVMNEVIDATNWLGLIVTVSTIPDSVDVGFGTPQHYARLGRIDMGTATAWYPTILLTHSPMIIRPLPPGVERVSVSVIPPATATVAPILPAP